MKFSWMSFLFFLICYFFNFFTKSDLFAATLQCQKIFTQANFTVEISDSKENTQFVNRAHLELLNETPFEQFTEILAQIIIINRPLDLNLTSEHNSFMNENPVEFIKDFRQNLSFLRSLFLIANEGHHTPKDFAEFVKEVGKLKDLIIINDKKASTKQASKILKKFKNINLDELMKKFTPAKRKNVVKYLVQLADETKMLLSSELIVFFEKKGIASTFMSYENLHSVRKNLRNILRYLEAQLLFLENSSDFSLKQNALEQQIQYLDRIDKKLGKICDRYAAQILQGDTNKDTLIKIPIHTLEAVNIFLDHVKFIKSGAS